MKLLVLIFLMLANTDPIALDPTGTYILGTTAKDKMGRYGELRVIKADSNTIKVSFLINEGAPGYNSGSFITRLEYINNKAVYAPEEYNGCRVIFTFSKKGVDIRQQDLHVYCGFGSGVYVNDKFRKVSSKVPRIADLTVTE